MSGTPLLAKSVDINKLKYSEVKTLKSGAKSVYVNYGSEKLTIQTPVLPLPYGLGEGFDPDKKAGEEKKESTDKK